MTKNKGFTLIEVLITVLVLAIGLLGLAGLQIAALRNGISSGQKEQASQLAYDMSDRLRSNMAEAKKGATSQYNTVGAANDKGCHKGTLCSPEDIAKNDLFLWNRDIGRALPSGSGAIVFSGEIYTISVSWDDKSDGENASAAIFAVRLKP